MKLATWNVNSIRIRLDQVVEWLVKHNVDILCLQETKVPDSAFPKKIFFDHGYNVISSGQAIYNGVAIISKRKLSSVVRDVKNLSDVQKRIIGCTINDVSRGPLRIFSVYCPNGSSLQSIQYINKIDWFRKLRIFLENELNTYQNIIVLGDFNVAPKNDDVFDEQICSEKILSTQCEREAFFSLLQVGFKDLFRTLSTRREFTWWDYRNASFRRNHGLRIDHILISHSLTNHFISCEIDKSPRASIRPSDHAPILAVLN